MDTVGNLDMPLELVLGFGEGAHRLGDALLDLGLLLRERLERLLMALHFLPGVLDPVMSCDGARGLASEVSLLGLLDRRDRLPWTFADLRNPSTCA